MKKNVSVRVKCAGRLRPRALQTKGTITVLTMFMLILLIAFVALGVELARLTQAKTELQRTADAAAMAAAGEYLDQLKSGADAVSAETAARQIAVQYAAANPIGNLNPIVDLNTNNSLDGDIYFGVIRDFDDHNSPVAAGNGSNYNSITVRVQRTASRNGEVPFLFGRIIGVNSKPVVGSATVAIARDIRGFRKPADSNLPFLPFALKESVWNDMMAGFGQDQWTWNPETNRVEPGADGIREANMFPQDTGASGNSGTINIGGGNNGTSTLRRQIEAGLNEGDMNYYNGTIQLDDSGQIDFTANPGLSAGMSGSLVQVIGQPRILPVYSTVTGNGSNATYTVVKFVGVTILEVDLTGSKKKSKRIIVQPAPITVKSVIPSSSDPGSNSDKVYSRPTLVR